MKKNLIQKLRLMDDNEKHFILIALAFILLIFFLIFHQTFYTNDDLKLPDIITGSGINEELDDIQKFVCITAKNNNECNKIDDSYIVRKYNCCVMEAICCAK